MNAAVYLQVRRYGSDVDDVPQILADIERGDPNAVEQLLPIVYAELRKLAAAKLNREKPGQTLQATALVHEAYLRLVGDDNSANWQSRGHFFAAAAEAMRRILIERARQKQSLKRGGDRQRERLTDIDLRVNMPSAELLDLNDALDKLYQQDEVKAQLVKLRFFGGLTIPQAASALGIAPSTADKYWAYARCWLQLEMEGRD